jgi:hypothetical protein
MLATVVVIPALNGNAPQTPHPPLLLKRIIFYILFLNIEYFKI